MKNPIGRLSIVLAGSALIINIIYPGLVALIFATVVFIIGSLGIMFDENKLLSIFGTILGIVNLFIALFMYANAAYNRSEYDLFGLVIFAIIFIITFDIGIFVTRRRAKKKEWNDSYKPAIIINVIWLIIDLILFIPTTIILIENYGNAPVLPIIPLIINIILGPLLVMKLYDKSFGKSVIFAIVLLIVIHIIWVVIMIVFMIILII